LGRLSTHVLDTALGKPAADVAWQLYRLEGAHKTPITKGVTNSDGRTAGPLLEGEAVAVGPY